ncbi:MAG: DUF1552 domain-containing protein [Deltaproteobacteria bacterium]|nr:DUF1552 domain-containing protein [Deltaproteobacteria bacterium]
MLFGDSGSSTDDGGEPDATALRRASVSTANLEDLEELRLQLDGSERAKLDLHVEAVREVEQRVLGTSGGGGTGSCEVPAVRFLHLRGALRSRPFPRPAQDPDRPHGAEHGLRPPPFQWARFQCSHHTSELLMSRFPGTEMYDPSYDMRSSHQASHYGSKHDWDKREFKAFVQQRGVLK